MTTELASGSRPFSLPRRHLSDGHTERRFLGGTRAWVVQPPIRPLLRLDILAGGCQRKIPTLADGPAIPGRALTTGELCLTVGKGVFPIEGGSSRGLRILNRGHDLLMAGDGGEREFINTRIEYNCPTAEDAPAERLIRLHPRHIVKEERVGLFRESPTVFDDAALGHFIPDAAPLPPHEWEGESRRQYNRPEPGRPRGPEFVERLLAHSVALCR